MKKFKWMLTACAVLSLCAGAVALSACGDESEGGVKNHEHVWDTEYIIKTQATCSQEGEQYHKCTVPGCTATSEPEVIRKKPHTWGAESKNTATCESGGFIVWTCTECGAEEQGNPTSALGHDDVLKEVKTEATCEHAGEKEMQCTRCKRVTTEEIAKLEHDYELDEEKSVKPTCKAPGKDVYVCVNGCNDVKEETVEQLDHTIENEDKKLPTFEEDGYRKGHCTACGDDIDEKIPKLIDGANVVFSYKIMKGDSGFTISTMTLKVVNEKGETVATGSVNDVVAAKYKVTLPIHKETTYTLIVENIKGYAAEEVTLTPAEPSGEVQVSAKMYEIGDPEAPENYYVGAMMQDFNFKDVDGNDIHLKEILKTKKLVMIEIFFGTCTICNQTAPELEALYQKYESQGLEILGISTDSQENGSDKEILKYRSKHGVTFPLVRQPASDTEMYLYKRFGFTMAPATVFIDHEGFIKEINKNVLSKEQLEERFQSYLSIEWKDLDGGEQTVAPKPGADGLTLSVIRGDYLLGDEKNS